jgi:transcriptional regulator with XRE-family HTH domain
MNFRLLNARRRELAISRPQLARSAGITERLLARLEDSPARDDEVAISIKTVRVLASALGLDLAELLPDYEAEETPACADPSVDAALISNIMFRVGQPTACSGLAIALDWDGARIDRAVVALRHALKAAGLRLREDWEGMAVAAAHDGQAEIAAAEIKNLAAEDDFGALELIWNVWRSGVERDHVSYPVPASQLPLARQLIASHVLEHNQYDELRVSSDIHRCLEPATPHDHQHIIGRY